MLRRSFLALLIVIALGCSPCSAQEFVLYAFPPAADLNWNSPLSLAWGAGVKGRFSFQHGKAKHTIGHCFMELIGADGTRELTGMTTAPDAPSDSDYITKKGFGLGVLFAPLQGALDASQKLDGELKKRYETGKVAFFRFRISQAQYARMKQYLTEYRARGYDKIYNGLNEPRKGLGAGCSAFAVSFLDITNLIDPVMEQQWIRRVNIPLSLIGGPLTGNTVSLAKLTVSAHWAKPGEPSRELVLYDPQLIFEWLAKEADKARFAKLHGAKPETTLLGKPCRFVRRGNAVGLYLDVSDCSVPADALWK